MKVYIVTAGAYSDYQIEAVFETMAEAEAFTNGAEKADANSEYVQITEWETGPPPDVHPFRETWTVWLSISDGSLREGPSAEWEQQPQDYSMATSPELCSGKDYVYAKSVVSAEHAIKVAVEERQRVLRSKT